MASTCCVCHCAREELANNRVPLVFCLSERVYREIKRGPVVPVIDEITGETLEERGNEFQQDPTLKVSQSSCSLRFHMTCVGPPPQAAYNKQPTGLRDVFEDGTGQRLGKECFIKDVRHMLCATCLQDCTQSIDTMYSRILPGNPCFVLLPLWYAHCS